MDEDRVGLREEAVDELREALEEELFFAEDLRREDGPPNTKEFGPKRGRTGECGRREVEVRTVLFAAGIGVLTCFSLASSRTIRLSTLSCRPLILI